MPNYLAVEAAIEIVSSYVGNNQIEKEDLPALINSVFSSVDKLSNPAAQTVVCEEFKPAVPVKKSVREDSITCLCCGKSFQSLKRHIKNSHGMTPEQYRIHWKLPEDYPMTAPAYSVRRSELAKDMGLGVDRLKKVK